MIPMRNSRFDVVIIGAGPAGTTCAALLSRRGIRVLLCDKAAFPREKICGDCINPECWDFFKLLGVREEVTANAERISGIQIAGRSGNVLDVPVRSTLSNKTGGPFVAIKRAKLDSILLHHAVLEGVTFCEATSIDSCLFEPSKNGNWQVRLRSREAGDITNIVCDTLIGADGRNSRVAKLLAGTGDAQKSLKEKSSDRIGVQFAVQRTLTSTSEVFMFFFKGGYGGIVGVTPEEANVAMVVTRDLAQLAMTDFNSFVARTIQSNQSAHRIVPELDLMGEIHTAFPIVPGGTERKYSCAYLIGDARRTTEPFTGEGVFFAMQDGLRTAHSILKSVGIMPGSFTPPLRSRFWRDNIFSPVLQRESMTESLLALGMRYNSLAQLASRMVFR